MVVDTDPSTQQHAIVVVCIVAPTICTLFVAMRIWTRIFVSHSIIGWDDCEFTRPFLVVLSLTRYRCCNRHVGQCIPVLA